MELLVWFSKLNTEQQVTAVVGTVVSILVLAAGYDIYQNMLSRKKVAEGWLQAALRRRGHMVERKRKRERRVLISTMIADKMTDYIEDLVYGEVITRDEATAQYLEMKRCFPKIRDAHPSPLLVKEKITKRRAVADKEPVPLPDKVQKKVRTAAVFK